MRLTWASPLLASLLLAGCADSAILLPATSKLLDEMPRVENSSKAPCWQQKQVAAQNSYLASIKEKKEVVYVAPCVVDKPPAVPAAKPDKPTS